MSAPIPISPPNNPVRNIVTPSSSLSVSPQTPFFPPPGLPGNSSLPQNNGANGATGTSFLKWAASSLSGSLARSPTSSNNPPPPSAHQGFAIPAVHEHHDEDHHDEHDSFEFGDWSDLKSRSWTQTKVRRAVSMSAGPGQISGPGAVVEGFATSVPVGTLGPGVGSGVLGDKAAKGQGVLRRLSLSGAGFTRPTFLSPPMTAAPLLPSPPSVPAPNPIDSIPTPPRLASPPKSTSPTKSAVVPIPVIGGPKGRRFSENAGNKKRGVSPMGERILRDHGHF